MRFYPFGSGSLIFYVESASKSPYAETTDSALRAISASISLTASIGDPGDNGIASTFHGPYESYPPTL